MNRPMMYELNAIANTPTGEREEHHPKMDFEDLMVILDGYVVGGGDETSWVFTVVKVPPKDWVVVVDPDHEVEVFGPFPEKGEAIEWGKSQFESDTDWIVRAIDKPIDTRDTRPVPLQVASA
jgi:hypothetical protein